MRKLEKYNYNVEAPNEENLDWLELKEIPEFVQNPFLDEKVLSEEDPAAALVRVLRNPEYIHFACKILLGFEPFPFQCVILETLMKKRFPLLVATRGGSKSTLLGVHAILTAIFKPGSKILLISPSFRQTKMVMDGIIGFWNKSDILRDICKGEKDAGPKYMQDRVQFRINGSIITALPLGNGEKIRGMRATHVLIDEAAATPEEILNLVVIGFAVVSPDPIQDVKDEYVKKRMIEMGIWSDEMERLKKATSDNQILYSGTAYFSFNHFYNTFKKWHDIIASKGDKRKLREILGKDYSDDFDWTDYAIIRLPYMALPPGFLKPHILNQAKANLSPNQFNMEFGATFCSDSDGFFKRSIIESATTNKPIKTLSGTLVQFSAMMSGDSQKRYIIGVDPAAEKDNAAIVILELNKDHRRVVHCWTTNRRKFKELKQELKEEGLELEDEYYTYIAKKIRHFMRYFNTERIIMDANGGGRSIAEALENKKNCLSGELPVYEVPDPNKPKSTDMLPGIHILQLLSPTSEINSDANHGMLSDLQQKVLLFPMFDLLELEKYSQLDIAKQEKTDTYEDLFTEIEELKNELTTITVTNTSTLGKEVFDTPAIKKEGQKKGYLRKDRYSALLYANYYARNKDKTEVIPIEYKALGGLKENLNTKTISVNKNGYYGPGTLKMNTNVVRHFTAVKRNY